MWLTTSLWYSMTVKHSEMKTKWYVNYIGIILSNKVNINIKSMTQLKKWMENGWNKKKINGKMFVTILYSLNTVFICTKKFFLQWLRRGQQTIAIQCFLCNKSCLRFGSWGDCHKKKTNYAAIEETMLSSPAEMDDYSYRQNFDRDKKNEIRHHS